VNVLIPASSDENVDELKPAYASRGCSSAARWNTAASKIGPGSRPASGVGDWLWVRTASELSGPAVSPAAEWPGSPSFSKWVSRSLICS
jgi:hypothetical protein